MQSAEEFVALIAKDGCYFNSSGDFKLSTNKTAPLIRARDREIVEACAEVVKEVMLAHGWYPGKAGIVEGSILTVLRDLD